MKFKGKVPPCAQCDFLSFALELVKKNIYIHGTSVIFLFDISI